MIALRITILILGTLTLLGGILFSALPWFEPSWFAFILDCERAHAFLGWLLWLGPGFTGLIIGGNLAIIGAKGIAP